MLTVKELVNATKGRLINGDENILVKKYSIDSREVDNETWFIPIIGEHTDGHKYIINCVKSEIIGTYINKDIENKEEIINEAISIKRDICIIEVEDTKIALKESGIYNRNKHKNTPVIAVTGSVGKTSTREMIATILEQKYSVLKTIKNYNSNIGFPLMLLMLEEQEICVFELGMDGLGQIEELSLMAKPDIAVITNIGTAHIGLLGSKDNIYKAKMEITKGLNENGLLLLNGDDEYLSKVPENKSYKVIKYSINDESISNIVLDELETKFDLKVDNTIYNIKINEPGKHQIYNALAGINLARYFGMDMKIVINGIDNFRNFAKRMEKIQLNNNITLIDDSYNASYDSIKSGLEVFEKMNYNRKIVVIGDMLELGDYSEELHRNVGKYLGNKKFDIIIAYGKDAKYIYEEASKINNSLIYFDSKEETSKYLKQNIKESDAIYFKASNGMKFIDIINEVKNYINK